MGTYIIISNSDGDTRIGQVSKPELLDRLSNLEDWYGQNTGFIKDLNEGDTNYWGSNIAIIKGELVVPKPATVVKTYEVD